MNNNFTSIEQMRAQIGNVNVPSVNSPKKIEKPIPTGENSFSSILEKTQKNAEGLKFSKHANNRLVDRNINLDSTQMERLEKARELSNSKGIKNSLVLLDKFAFIMNVPSSTVITAMDSEETKENAFTNIDGAVIV